MTWLLLSSPSSINADWGHGLPSGVSSIALSVGGGPHAMAPKAAAAASTDNHFVFTFMGSFLVSIRFAPWRDLLGRADSLGPCLSCTRKFAGILAEPRRSRSKSRAPGHIPQASGRCANAQSLRLGYE